MIGAGIVLQHLSPRGTLLIFAVGLGILAAARILVRPPAEQTQPPRPDTDPMTTLCRCFGADIGDSCSGPFHEPGVKQSVLETAREH